MSINEHPWPVAISGLGCICAAGASVDACLETLYRGSRSPAAPTLFTSDHPTSYPVFEVTSFAEPPGLERTAGLALHAAREALEDAGLDGEALPPLRVGVCIGTTMGCAISNEPFCRAYLSGLDPDLAPIDRVTVSNPAAAIAREFGFTGPCQTLVNACASGTDAVGVAASWIRGGLCDVVVAGGADGLGRITYNGFISLMITDGSPCKPFDRDRKGLNLGEGAAMLVLESEGSLLRRGRKPRSLVLGYGSASDAFHLTAPAPDGEGLRSALAEALSCCAIPARSIAFVNAHGTGTADNDRIESAVLADLLPGVPFFSTKGYTGHTLGAAGAIEAVFTVACLERGRIPGSAGFSAPDPELAATPVTETCSIEGGIALSESLGFGGNNAVLVVGRGDAR